MWLTVRDVARLLEVSEKTVYRWVNQGRIPVYRVGEQYRFSRAEVQEWATAGKIGGTALLLEDPAGPSSETPRLSDALDSGGIAYRLGGKDRDGVLSALVAMLRLPEEVDRPFVYDVLRAREALGSTAIGDGIAIPHPRSPIVQHIARASVSLAFLEEPVDFGALDGKPVFALFTILSPSVRVHIHLLSRLVHALRDPDFRGAIARVASRDEIVRELSRVEATLPGGSS